MASYESLFRTINELLTENVTVISGKTIVIKMKIHFVN